VIWVRLWVQIWWRDERLHNIHSTAVTTALHNIHSTAVTTAAEMPFHSLPHPPEETTKSFLLSIFCRFF